MTGSSSWVFDSSARPARHAPMASAPVSPMNIRAGNAFHHRKPAHAPAIDGGDDGKVEGVGDLVHAGSGRPRSR